MSKLGKVIYGLFGEFTLLYGTLLLLVPTALQSEAATSFHLAHNLREQGAAIIFLGLMSLWCLFNYYRARTVHCFLTIFTFLLAAIHWFDYLNGRLPWMSPLYNTIPFIVFATMGFANRHTGEV